jgi:hypothetical protein
MNESIHGKKTASELEDELTEVTRHRAAISEVLRANTKRTRRGGLTTSVVRGEPEWHFRAVKTVFDPTETLAP